MVKKDLSDDIPSKRRCFFPSDAALLEFLGDFLDDSMRNRNEVAITRGTVIAWGRPRVPTGPVCIALLRT